MADTQSASIGWGGTFFFNDGTALYEAVQVVSFQLPSDEVDEVETTHLKSPNRRKEFISGLIDGGEVEVVLNFRPGSDTDTKLEAWKAAGVARAVKFGVPINGTVVREYSTTAINRGYPGTTVSAGDKMEATLRLRITGAVTSAAPA